MTSPVSVFTLTLSLINPILVPLTEAVVINSNDFFLLFGNYCEVVSEFTN